MTSDAASDRDRPEGGPDRRSVLRGTGAAALGISTLALPSAASALSVAGARISEVTVYWSEMDSANRIGRLTFDGTTATSVDSSWKTGLADPRGLSTDGTFLYFRSGSSGVSERGIWRVDPATGAAVRLVDVTSVGGLFVDDQHIYYTRWTGGADSGVYRIAKDGTGSATTLVSSNSSYSGVFAAGDTVYFTEYSANRVSSVPKVGGSVTVLATNISTPASIEVLGEVIYVGQGSDRFVRRLSLAGGSLGSISTIGYVNGLHVAAATVFVSTGNSAALQAFDLGGANGRTFAQPFATLTSIGTSGIAVIY